MPRLRESERRGLRMRHADPGEGRGREERGRKRRRPDGKEKNKGVVVVAGRSPTTTDNASG